MSSPQMSVPRSVKPRKVVYRPAPISINPPVINPVKKANIVFSEVHDEEFSKDEADDQGLNILLPYFLGSKKTSVQSSLQSRVLASLLPPIAKELVMKRLENSDLDKPKQLEWVESILSIPFGKYAPMPVSIKDSQDTLKKFFEEAIHKFDEQVCGLDNVKQEMLNYLGQFITAGNKCTPRVLALYGSAGCGKTHLVRTALTRVLGRPMKCINMGGVKDSVFLIGFDYTYSSARYGMLVQTLIEKQVMNPVILFEEVDKISETKEGLDLQGILMSLTDPETNKEFQDKYFQGVDVDFSKAIIVFTLNDPTMLHPVLYNRLNLVKIPDPSVQDKIAIAIKHMIPNLCTNIGFDISMVKFSPEIIKYINNKYSAGDKGLRTLRRNIESIILRLNIIKLTGIDFQGKLQLTFPLTVNEKIADTILYQGEQDPIHYSLYG